MGVRAVRKACIVDGAGVSFTATPARRRLSPSRGLIGLTQVLTHDAAAHVITGDGLCTGWTPTERLNLEGQTPAFRQFAASENPQRRVLGPNELGAMAMSLAAAETAGGTGQVFCGEGSSDVGATA
jgi:NAD(P)-dependent dehydrogenase (short-subunit alcohol dehydrogenase family)